jgi:hypothetical protein
MQIMRKHSAVYRTKAVVVYCVSRDKYQLLHLSCVFCLLYLTVASNLVGAPQNSCRDELLMVEVLREKDSKLCMSLNFWTDVY